MAREAIADAIARGIDYAGEVAILVGIAERLLLAADRETEDWTRAAEAVRPHINSTYSLREPATYAIYRADLVVVEDSGVRKELEDYMAALFAIQKLVSHCTDVLDGTEEFDPSRVEARMDTFFSALGALTTASRNHLRPQT